MKQLKKVTIACAMAMVVATTTVPATNAYAATKACTQSQNCDFTKGKLCYTITGNNTCTVTGLSQSGETSKSCTIPSTVKCNGTTYNVTKVAANAFKNCDNLKKVTINGTSCNIGNNAFTGCNNLNNVTLSNAVNKVGSNAFNNCSNLKNIFCSNNLKTSGNNCFGNAILNFNSCK